MPQLSIEQVFRKALEHHQSGQLPEAENLYRQILSQQPNHMHALQYLGVLAHQMGKNDVAVDLIRQAIALQSDNAEAYSNLGAALMDKGQLEEAVTACRRAIVLNPDFPQAHYNLGNALRSKGQLDEAIAAYGKAIALKADYPEAHYNLGTMLSGMGEVEKSIGEYRRTISLRPNFPQVHYNLGNALRSKGKLDEAIASYRQAITFNPNYAEAYSNLGNALKDRGQVDQAITAFRQAIVLKPDYPEAHSNLVFTLHFHPGYDAKTIADEQRCWNRQHAEPLKQFIQPHLNDRNPERRLRIGYVSADFRDHPVGRFLLPLLENHEKAHFEVFGYSQSSLADAVTQRLRSCADCWRSIWGVADAQAADLIRQDKIDILIDLAGHTGENRLLVFARKPATVQATWLGYPGSTGLATIDYRLSDPYLDPPGMNEAIYSERTIRLPETFWCYDPLDCRDIVVNPPPVQANGFITFGCLSNFCKVNATNLALWEAVLRQVNDSRLLLLANRGSHVQQTAEALRQHGIDPRRVEFIPRQPHREYLKQFHRIDLALDSFPYNGHTTSLDGLWMGVPCVTMPGRTAVGRAGVSILSNLGLPELIAHSEDEYVRIVVELAHDLPRLSNLRSTLRSRMEKSPLMDAPRFARNIETAYRQMWHAWCQTISAGT